MTEPSVVIHALLIGIDYYEPNQLYKSLKGAVRDINLVEAFLSQSLNLPADRIHKLISPHREDADLLALRSAQAPEPTYANIVNAFDTITAKAQPGEQVYIHYSGHGGRAKTVYPTLKTGSGDQYDEGLVPMDIGNTQAGRYLRDVEMTTLLKRMTDKGLVVTVVLDSCHSGGATRGDAEIRSGTEPDLQPRTAESLVASQEELERNWLALTRQRGIGTAGLPNARDYVLLAACRPNEFAYEYAVSGGQERHGALTYWMIDTLTAVATSGQPLTYKLLHDRLNAQIQSKFPRQLPMIMGESDRLVFGSDTWTTPYTVSVMAIDLDRQQITLNAGQAQGLSKGTRFAIYPPNTTDFTDKGQQVAIAEISKRPDAASAIARILDLEEGGIAPNGTPDLGAPAVMISAPVDLVQRVRLVEKTAGDREQDLPAALVDRQSAALERVRQALAGNGWVVEAQAEEASAYQVAIDRQGHYEICREMPIPNLRPLLAIDDPAAPQQVVDRLVHLAKYQAVQSLDNASSKLRQTLSIELLTEDGDPFPDPQNPVVEDGEIVTLRLTNRGTQPLKIAVLDIEPTWAISQIPLGGMESPFFQLAEGAQEEMQLAMSIPDDEAYEQSVEILKAFAIQNGLAAFRWLTLPPLDAPPAPRGASFGDELGSATRGMADEGINPLNSLMTMIGADLENAPTTTRAATLVTNPKDEWFTQQIQIVVKG
ncbi:caspase [filamentous cyanobacterium CCP3]|nr:caspase [filamentous cyanobacterium CCP3]